MIPDHSRNDTRLSPACATHEVEHESYHLHRLCSASDTVRRPAEATSSCVTRKPPGGTRDRPALPSALVAAYVIYAAAFVRARPRSSSTAPIITAVRRRDTVDPVYEAIGRMARAELECRRSGRRGLDGVVPYACVLLTFVFLDPWNRLRHLLTRRHVCRRLPGAPDGLSYLVPG